MVRKCLDAGMPVKTIQNIRSCYDGVSEKGCGRCIVCVKKAVALINNGIFREDLFDEPITIDVLKESLAYVTENNYSEYVAQDIRRAIKVLRQQ